MFLDGLLTLYCHEDQLLAAFLSHVPSHDLYHGQVSDPVPSPDLDSFPFGDRVLLDHDPLVHAGLYVGLLVMNFDGLDSCVCSGHYRFYAGLER